MSRLVLLRVTAWWPLPEARGLADLRPRIELVADACLPSKQAPHVIWTQLVPGLCRPEWHLRATWDGSDMKLVTQPPHMFQLCSKALYEVKISTSGLQKEHALG